MEKKSPLTFLPARSMNFFIMSLGKLAKTSNLNARLAALFATSLLQTMQRYSEPAPLRLKSARSSRLDYNPPIEKDMMGTWIRQISTTIDDVAHGRTETVTDARNARNARVDTVGLALACAR